MNTYGCNKPEHFIEFYERNLIPRKPKVLLEIGVQTGRSLKMWSKAMPSTSVVGLDRNVPTEELPRGVMFLEGDQTDENVLKSIGRVDAVIDDGSHMSSHQQKTFELLFPQLNSGGLYVIEDLEINRQEQFKDTPLSTLEYFAEKIKPIKESNHLEYKFKNEGIKSITFCDNLLAVEKL